MPNTRLALVASDPNLAEAVRNLLGNSLGQSPTTCNLISIRDWLRPEGEGLLIAATGATAGSEFLPLVQEIRLQQWPTTIIVVQTSAAARANDLSALDPHVAGRFLWPDNVRPLVKMARDNLAPPSRDADMQATSVRELIARRLACQTPSLLPMAESLALAAAHDVTVLLGGPTGTGKTYLARLIHEFSPRHHQRLLAVPCGALSPSLIGSELFGHVQGAFTGADRPKMGKFEAAGNGTILLDEIDALPLEHQAALLRVLETGEYEPVGGHRTQVSTARVIAASNLDLEEAVRRGQFRPDLYYRLNVISFHLPPLAQRPQDIPPLARLLAARANTAFRKDLFDIHPEAMDAFVAFPWPGNIRQLENVVQQAVLLSRGPELLGVHLPLAVRDLVPATRGHRVVVAARGTLSETCTRVERDFIQRALVNNNYRRTDTAATLGISRVALYKKLKKYELTKKPFHVQHA